MNSTLINKIRSRLGWTIKKRRLKKCGINSRVGYDCVLRCPQFIEIGDNFIAGKCLTIETWNQYKGKIFKKNPAVMIGNGVSIMDDCQISAANCVFIGDGCLLGSNVFITDNYHGDNSYLQLQIPPVERPLCEKDGVHIGKNVWIGRNVCIMPGVTIGDGTVIGANAVVTNNVPSYCVAVGVPAKVIKHVNKDEHS